MHVTRYSKKENTMVTIPRSVEDFPVIERSRIVPVRDLHPAPATFSIEIQGKVQRAPYERLFEVGHQLWIYRSFSKAIPLFELLNRVLDRGPRASMLLAHCYAMELRFADCSRTLFDALDPSIYRDAASRLHDIFVMWSCTFHKFVRVDLEEFVTDYPELPTPALLLGDFYVFARHFEKSARCFELAIQRDFKGGAVAKIARDLLEKNRSRLQR